MSDIAGPPAPKDIQPQIRGADKTAPVSKDPNSTNTPTGDQPREQAARDHSEAQTSRDPAVSIASTAAHLVPGQEITATVSKIDAEGRPIIVTETVTLALKPTAGLQANDTVQLKVVDTGKQVTADLFRQNTVKTDPSVRLSVTVIEVHLPSKVQSTPNAQQPEPKLGIPYSGPKRPVVTNPASVQTQTADLPALIGRSTSLHATTTEDKRNIASTANSNTPIARSADLAALIQQQSATSSERPKSTNPLAASGSGIGPAISGVSVGGAPAVIQLLDTSISTVRPADVATVQNVQNVTAAEARGLPIGASELSMSNAGGTSGELVKLETSLGDFILRANDAAPLSGELVRVSVGTTPSTATAGTTEPQTNTEYRALLIENRPGAVPTQTNISFLDQTDKATDAAGNIATITSVKTASAFFGANGPKTDLRLQTSLGDVSVTVPSGLKPQVGDKLAVLLTGHDGQAGGVTQSVAEPTLPAGTLGTDSVAAAQSAHTQGITTAPNVLASWPAMEESLAALIGTNSAAATSLTAKTAQGGSKFTNSLLFFMKAAGMGNGGNWIGNEVEKALARSSQVSLGKLRSDIGQLASLAGETIGEWRPILLPFDARGGEVPLAALLLGQRQDVDPEDLRDDSTSDDQDKEKGQRFILQVQFSVFGDIQLDGNISKHVFDLTVRSKSDLPNNLRQDSTDLFYSSLAANGFTGSINFLQQDQFSVDAAALIEDHMNSKKTEQPTA